MPPDLFRKVDTMFANVAARKIGAMSHTTRIGSMRFPSGTYAFSKLFALHRAELLNSCLRAVDSDVKFCLEKDPRNYFGVDTGAATSA